MFRSVVRERPMIRSIRVMRSARRVARNSTHHHRDRYWLAQPVQHQQPVYYCTRLFPQYTAVATKPQPADGAIATPPPPRLVKGPSRRRVRGCWVFSVHFLLIPARDKHGTGLEAGDNNSSIMRTACTVSTSPSRSLVYSFQQ